jgi:serine/threonine-protein kinase
VAGEALEQTLDENLAAKARTIQQRPSETIVPDRFKSDHAARALAEFGSDGARSLSSSVRIGRTIGEGGMGVIRVAEQLSLGRNVATKSLKPQVRERELTIRLLREAWVTASLEHPNVVPIYDLGADEHGRPLIVLKHIEGTSWSSLVSSPAEVERRFGATDLLEWNLRVLSQVANALHFAHSRGIVHRDLKPENVMIGSFGEVYLLDWGIAVSTRDDPSGRFLLAKDSTELAGTPNYMAPEMLGGEAATERTDVYLLGSTLFEIACGRPPHEAPTMMAVVSRVVLSEPAIDPAVPADLAAIIRRAMHKSPAGRFESANELRLAVEAFLSHRHARGITARAYERLAALKEAIAEQALDRVPHVFTECRFAFQTALDAWADNDDARKGLDEAHRAMIDHALSRDDPESARVSADSLSARDPDVDARIEKAIAERAEKAARLDSLAKLGREHDPTIGRRTRLFLGTMSSGSFILAHLALALWTALAGDGWIAPLALNGAGLVFVTIGILWARESMLGSRTNRTIVGALYGGLVAQLAMYAGAFALGISPVAAGVFAPLVWASFALMTAAAVSVRPFGWLTAAFAGAFVVSLLFPEHRFLALALAQLAFFVPVVIATQAARPDYLRWKKDREREAEP